LVATAIRARGAAQTFSLLGLKWWAKRSIASQKGAVAQPRHATPLVTIRAGINASFQSAYARLLAAAVTANRGCSHLGGRSVSVRARLLRWDRSPPSLRRLGRFADWGNWGVCFATRRIQAGLRAKARVWPSGLHPASAFPLRIASFPGTGWFR